MLIGKAWPETPIPDGVTLLRDWPNGAVREAMRRSLALVAPSVCPEAIPEIVRDGQEALLVEPGNVGALAGALARIADDDALRDRLAASALIRADSYTAATVVPQFEAVYEQALLQRTARFD